MPACILVALFASLGFCSSREKDTVEDASWASDGNDLNILEQGDGASAMEDETSLLQLLTGAKEPKQAQSKEPMSAVRRYIIEEHDIMTKLWSGMDLKQSELLAIRSRQHEDSHSGSVRETDQSWHDKAKRVAGPFKKLHLLGPPHCGTNLFAETLHLNWPEESFDACGSSTDCDNVVWKHSISNASDLNRRFESAWDRRAEPAPPAYDVTYDSVIVILTRSPISQMVSWHHRPYSLAPCFERSFAEASSPCFANTSPDWHDVVKGCDVNVHSQDSIDFNSSSDVWNTYVKQYLDMKGSQEVGPVLMVSFEELVLDPRVVFRQLAELMGWPMPEHFSILDSAAYQSTSSRDEVVQRLSSRSHLSEVTSSELEVLCSGLEKSLLAQLYENPHASANVTYEFDCLQRTPQADIK
mmetsp:Transcript_130798/g.240592  ORF Transcript_130798/g.240592 Transcript_130798/m.240592 type:complete len:412 (+) Transcript_130798:92-1327(+)